MIHFMVCNADIIAGRKTVGEFSGAIRQLGHSGVLKSELGYMEQKHALLEHLTVEEHFRCAL